MKRLCLAACLLALISACRQAMDVQPRLRADSPSAFFADGAGNRPAVAGAVARETPMAAAQAQGLDAKGREAGAYPMPLSRKLLLKGQERYGIYCAPCHGLAGYGTGIITRHGFPNPPSFHQDAMRKKPVGHFVRVMARGYGAMASYAARVPAADRWAIAAYIRALQLSQNARLSDLNPDERQKLKGGRP